MAIFTFHAIAFRTLRVITKLIQWNKNSDTNKVFIYLSEDNFFRSILKVLRLKCIDFHPKAVYSRIFFYSAPREQWKLHSGEQYQTPNSLSWANAIYDDTAKREINFVQGCCRSSPKYHFDN